MISRPRGVWTTSGWNCRPNSFRARFSMAANWRIFRDGDRLEMARQFRELIAVRVPDLDLPRQAVKEYARRILHGERALAVFALLAFLDPAAEELREQLHAVADAKHRHAERENVFVRQRRILGVNRRRPAGEDDAARLERGDFYGRRVVAEDLGINVALADPARNDLGVLRPEVEDNDLFVHEIKNPNALFACARWFWRAKNVFTWTGFR